MSDQTDPAATARSMPDDLLVSEWDAVTDHESLTPLQQAIIDEIERRNLDL